jgi:hypothetical protein
MFGGLEKNINKLLILTKISSCEEKFSLASQSIKFLLRVAMDRQNRLQKIRFANLFESIWQSEHCQDSNLNALLRSYEHDQLIQSLK